MRPNLLAKLGLGLATAGPSSKSRVRVLIVDDSAPFRQAVGGLLERRGCTVVGEASSAASALEAATRLRPDAVLLDVHLPDGNGFDVTAALCCSPPAPAVLLVSMHDLARPELEVRDCGARGFVPKSELATTDLSRFWPISTRAGDPI